VEGASSICLPRASIVSKEGDDRRAAGDWTAAGILRARRASERDMPLRAIRGKGVKKEPIRQISLGGVHRASPNATESLEETKHRLTEGNLKSRYCRSGSHGWDARLGISRGHDAPLRLYRFCELLPNIYTICAGLPKASLKICLCAHGFSSGSGRNSFKPSEQPFPSNSVSGGFALKEPSFAFPR